MSLVAPIEVGITTSNIKKSVEFYSSLFGLTLVSEIVVEEEAARTTSVSTTGYTVVRLQSPFGERLKILQPSKFIKGSDNSECAGVINLKNRSFLAFIVDSLEKTLVDLIELGGSVLDKPTLIRKGMHMAFAKDPDGNFVELVEFDSISEYRSDLTNS